LLCLSFILGVCHRAGANGEAMNVVTPTRKLHDFTPDERVAYLRILSGEIANFQGLFTYRVN
jgi:hypothetical protein